jgi:hypothetical protein
VAACHPTLKPCRSSTKQLQDFNSLDAQYDASQAYIRSQGHAGWSLTLVIKSVRDHLNLPASMDDRSLINDHVARVEFRSEELVIQLVQPAASDRKNTEVDCALRVPWQKTPTTRRREILPPATVRPQDARPIRSETRATLVASIARGRRWLDELIADAKVSAESTAKRERCSVRQVNMTISLAFLAPNSCEGCYRGPTTTRCWRYAITRCAA